MTNLLKGDIYRLRKSKFFYSIIAFTCALAFALIILIRQDIRLGISIYGNITIFKRTEDIIRFGVQYQKGIGLLIAVLISAFISQEYLWKTWQHKWVISKSRIYIYLSKTVISSAVSIIIFLVFEVIVLFFQGRYRKYLHENTFL